MARTERAPATAPPRGEIAPLSRLFRAIARRLSPPVQPPGSAPAPSPPSSYKDLWDAAARKDARDAILTNADDESFERTGREDAQRIVALLERPADARVLNVGCGIGRVELHLAPLVREMCAVDVSGEMIRRAGERLAALPNVALREVAVGEYLRAFPDASFDLVFSLLVLQHLEREDAFRYLEEARRVLRPGGVLFAQFPNFLSPEYSESFQSAVGSSPLNPARVRAYTEPEVRHVLGMLGFELRQWTASGGSRGDAEFYATAVRP